MSSSLRVLMVEDSQEDAAQLLLELQRGGYETAYQQVETSESLKTTFSQPHWDFAFVDCRMLHLGSTDTLAFLREKDPDLSIIIVSDRLTEELAVSAMKTGANDYIEKNNLKRLLPVVERELRERNLRRERRQAEERLLESEERFRQLTENITEVFWMTSAGMTEMLYISPGYERIWGRTCKSLYEKPDDWLDAIHPDDRSKIEKASRTFPDLGAIEEVEYRIIRPDGSIRWIRAKAFPVRDASGQVYRIAGIAEDITDRKSTEKALKDAKAFSENLIQTANVIILGLDNDGKINIFNETAEKITGYTASELNGRNWFETLVPRDRYPQVWEEFQRLISGGVPETFENPILTKTGRERFIIWRNNQIRVDGKVVGTISFGNDITDYMLSTTQDSWKEKVDLTRREKEVLSWIMAGKSNSEISTILNISEHGVDFHVRNLFKKLGVTSRAGAAVRGAKMGLIDPS